MKIPFNRINVKKIISWVMRVILVQLILINISAAFHAHRFTHFYDDKKVRKLPTSKGNILLRTWRMMVGRKYPKSQIHYHPPMPYDTISLQLENGNRIRAWHIKRDSSIGTVIMMHGLGSNKADLLAVAEEFLGFGFNVFLPDLRAHGESDGKVATLGAKETEELNLSWQYIRSSGENKIILWGISLGAVIITKGINDYNLQPEKVILEMPFNRLQDHIRARARIAGFPGEPFGFLVTGWIGIEQGYWSYSHQTADYAAKITCPVLLQWGAQDNYVRQVETEKIFSGIGSEKKSMVVYDYSGHAPLLWHEPGKWIATVSGFLNND